MPGHPMKAACRLLLGVLLVALLGCQTPPARSRSPDISLESAKELILARQVKSIFQPHQGCVLLTMKDGRYLRFEQPHLDWVVSFVADNKLLDVIPVEME